MELNKAIIKILIVEDETIIAFSIKSMLEELGYSEIKIANTEDQARALINSIEFNLVMLDINLKHGDEGLRLASECHVKSIPFFYISSYTDKSTLDKAIETAPGAYIIKPFLPSNLYSAIELTLSNKSKQETNYLNFKDGNNTVRIACSEIIYLKADGVYIEVVSASKKYLTRNSLKNISKDLPKDSFIQTHRSYIINKNFLSKICSNHIELGEYDIPISRSFKAIIKEEFPV